MFLSHNSNLYLFNAREITQKYQQWKQVASNLQSYLRHKLLDLLVKHRRYAIVYIFYLKCKITCLSNYAGKDNYLIKLMVPFSIIVGMQCGLIMYVSQAILKSDQQNHTEHPTLPIRKVKSISFQTLELPLQEGMKKLVVMFGIAGTGCLI